MAKPKKQPEPQKPHMWYRDRNLVYIDGLVMIGAYPEKDLKLSTEGRK